MNRPASLDVAIDRFENLILLDDWVAFKDPNPYNNYICADKLITNTCGEPIIYSGGGTIVDPPYVEAPADVLEFIVEIKNSFQDIIDYITYLENK